MKNIIFKGIFLLNYIINMVDENDLFETKGDKKIYPVLNDSNFKINLEQVLEIFKKGGLTNITPQKLNLYQNAFIHKSYLIDNDFVKNEKYYGNINALSLNNNLHILPLQNKSNETLEWLGDGILQAVSALYLYERFGKDQDEGFLTKLRSKLVKTETLSKLALALGFDKYLIISKHVEIISQGRKNARILEDCFESFIGAMMEDFGKKNYGDGINIIYKFLINVIEDNIDIASLILVQDNYKDQLMRYFQKEFDGKFPVYEQSNIENIVNNKGISYRKFTMCVRDTIGNIIGKGDAKSKKEAEQKAAQSALKNYGITNGY
jgi:ribonuclease-3